MDQVKFTKPRLRYPGRNKPYLQTKARTRFHLPSQSVRIAAKRSLITENGAEKEREREREGGAREREREGVCVRERESQRDEKDKGKTDGTIDLCVKSTGAPLLLLLLLFFLSKFPSDKKKKNPNRLLG